MIIIYNACGTLLIDLNPLRPAAAQASLNLIRCSLAAASLAALEPLINGIGVGWCFTIIGLTTGGTATACVTVARISGEQWTRSSQAMQTETASG